MNMAGLEKGGLQRQTLRFYGELLAREAAPGGCLVFAAGAGCSATGLPAAVGMAGGTMLALDPDAAAVKKVLRGGGLDFVVNNLDEALRVLKNEIRQRRPLSVGLIAEVASASAEMRERGVLPDFAFSAGPVIAADEEFLRALAAAGMQDIRLEVAEGLVRPSEMLATWLAERGWVETGFDVDSVSDLKTLDGVLLQLVPEGDLLRRAWLHRVGHYQRSSVEAGRTVWLSDAEHGAVAAKLRKAGSSLCSE